MEEEQKSPLTMWVYVGHDNDTDDEVIPNVESELEKQDGNKEQGS